ncbi:MAG: hypothetical protein IJO10_02355 [Clostridia bacterium]|nr:hypothetical protein [Clostridia bacterium]
MEKQNTAYQKHDLQEQDTFPTAAEAQHSTMDDEQAVLDADALLRTFEADYRRLAQ